jgi:cystathionine beta-lyase
MNNLNTKCVHAGKYIDKNSFGINTPVFASTAHFYPNDLDEIRYPRWNNTLSHRAVAEKIRILENGEAGMVFSSGMAAEACVFFTLLQKGDHAVFQAGLYGGTQQLINELNDYGIETDIVNSTIPADFEEKVKDNTKFIYLETPTNPLLRITDLSELSELAKRKGIMAVVDNTFATPINQNPLDFGIDIVTHSGTKYLNGHSDIICGAVACSAEIMENIQKKAVIHGGTLNVQDCSLLERGLKTLGIRVSAQNDSAMKISEYLESNPKVRKVYYPGLASHPDHTVARKQMRGFGGMLSFEMDCDRKTTDKFVKNLNLIYPAVSLGGVESILCFPADTSHIRVPKEERIAQGISDNLIRLSVGIEDTEDLLEDIDYAINSL